MAWSAESQITTALSLASTIAYGNASAEVTLNPGESAEVQISATFTGTSTADLWYRVITSNDGSRYDTTPFIGGSVGRVVSTTQTRTFLVSGVKNFKVEYAQSASDAQAITIDTYVIKNGISV